jgi:hypothetical protein
VLSRLTAVVARHERFAFALTELRTFPRTVWLAPGSPVPRPDQRDREGVPADSALGRAFDEVIPRVKLTDGVEEHVLAATLARLRSGVGPPLPVAVAADEVTVLREQEEDQMAVAARLPLG